MTKVPLRTLTYACGLALLAYAASSLAWSPVAYGKSLAIVQLAGLGLAFSLGAWVSKPRLLLWFLLGLGCANLPWIAGDMYFDNQGGFEGWAGFMGNPNLFGSFLVVAIAVAIAYGYWWYLPFGVAGLYLSGSRGATLAAGLVLFCGLCRRWPVIAFTTAVIGVICLAELSPPHRDIGILARMGVWQDTLNHLTFWGSGFGSFFDAYDTWAVHTNMTLLRPPHAYNDFLELLFELGIGSLPLWFLIILSFEGLDPRPKLVVFAFLTAALTYFPLTFPFLSQLFAFFLGQAARTLETNHGTLEAFESPLPQGNRGWGTRGMGTG